MFYIYILYSSSIDKYYVGHTDDISRRLNEHNTGQTRFTSQRGVPWILVYHESFATRAEAVKREKEIKSKKKRAYIESLVRASRL